MTHDAEVLKFSKTISPSKITSFLSEGRAMLDEMESMANSTPVADQAYGAAKVFKKYNLI